MMPVINGREYQIEDITPFPGYVKFEPVVEPGYFDIANDADMQLVDEWCREHRCGKRSAFNKFFFATDAEMTMFRMRWA